MNPKDREQQVNHKLPVHLVPAIMADTASIAFYAGAHKYGRSNWREDEVFASVYLAAAQRHLARYMEGEELDTEGVPNLGAALASIGIILDAQLAGKLIDDRQYGTHSAEHYSKAVDGLMEVLGNVKASLLPREKATDWDRRENIPSVTEFAAAAAEVRRVPRYEDADGYKVGAAMPPPRPIPPIPQN